MSSFILKLIAAVTMFIDHMGLTLFPGVELFRIIGRLAFPLYAFCIAEGFRYTKNRLRYFLQIFLLGLVCQVVYAFVEPTLYLGILITFSLSILLLASTEQVKDAFSGQKSALAKGAEALFHAELSGAADRAISLLLLLLAGGAVFLLTVLVPVDYGFFGVLLPVFTNLFRDKKKRLVLFSACLLTLCIDLTGAFSIQYFSLFAILLLALYNGKPGKYRFKYFFYVFYPAHLAFLYGLSMIL